MESEVKACTFCGEEIKGVAVKCRYCGELVQTQEINEAETVQTTSSLVKVIASFVVISLIIALRSVGLLEFITGGSTIGNILMSGAFGGFIGLMVWAFIIFNKYNGVRIVYLVVFWALMILGLLFLGQLIDKDQTDIANFSEFQNVETDKLKKESKRVSFIEHMRDSNPEATGYYVIYYSTGWGTYNYDGEYVHTYNKLSDCEEELIRGKQNSNKFTTSDWQCVSF